MDVSVEQSRPWSNHDSRNRKICKVHSYIVGVGDYWQQKNEPAEAYKVTWLLLDVNCGVQLCCLANQERRKRKTLSHFLIVLVFQCGWRSLQKQREIGFKCEPVSRASSDLRFYPLSVDVVWAKEIGLEEKCKFASEPVWFLCLCLMLMTNVTICARWMLVNVLLCICTLLCVPLSTYNQCWWWEAIDLPTVPLVAA